MNRKIVALLLLSAASSAQDAYAAPVEGKAHAQVPGGSAKQHHDWRRLTNGNTLVLANLVHPLQGFSAPQVLDDVIYEVNQQGDIVWKWVASEHLNEFGFSAASLKLVKEGASPRGKATPFDYLHINNMSVLGPNKWFDAGDKRFNPENGSTPAAIPMGRTGVFTARSSAVRAVCPMAIP